MLKNVEDTIISCIKVGMSYCKGHPAILEDLDEYYLVDIINGEPYVLKDTDFEKKPIINKDDIKKYDIDLRRCCQKLNIDFWGQHRNIDRKQYKYDDMEIEIN